MKSKTQNHQLQIFQLQSQSQYQAMFHYHYQVYLKNGYILQNPKEIDYDKFDAEPNCVYVLATLDENIIGSLRIMYGEVIPTFDYYYKLNPATEIEKLSKTKCLK